jgi:syntaxin 1B/2/3
LQVGSTSERTRTSITAGLKKKLKDLMGDFSELRSRIHEEYREVVERRVYTVTGA